VPHAKHGKATTKQPDVWWEKNNSKVALGGLMVAMVAAMTLAILMQN
jgi:hypothetical protein